MNAVPPVIPGLEVDPTGRYACPLCKVQRASDEVDTGWVACPMVRGQMVCLGSCLDYQAVARSSAFETHYDYPPFIQLEQEARQLKRGLRTICLRHQAELIDDQLRSQTDDVIELTARKDEVSQALAEVSYNPTQLVQRVWSSPPRCLGSLRVESLSEPPYEGVADQTAFFHVSCPCGSASVHILGYQNDLVAGCLLCPLSVQCSVCNRVLPLFDATEHGYDGEYGHYSDSADGSSKPRQYDCPKCSGVTFAACVAFSYQIEEGDADELEAEHPGRIQDFFDWFSLDVRCEHCGTLSTAADCECA